jgi:hypothetical protein
MVSVVSFRMDPEFNRPDYQVTDARYDLLAEWAVTDLGTFFFVVLDALAMAAEVARGEEPFDEWSSENYEVSFTPSVLRLRNLWVPGGGRVSGGPGSYDDRGLLALSGQAA